MLCRRRQRSPFLFVLLFVRHQIHKQHYNLQFAVAGRRTGNIFNMDHWMPRRLLRVRLAMRILCHVESANESLFFECSCGAKFSSNATCCNLQCCGGRETDGPTSVEAQSVAVMMMGTKVTNVLPSCHQETYKTFLATMATSTLGCNQRDDRTDSLDIVANPGGNPEVPGVIPAPVIPSLQAKSGTTVACARLIFPKLRVHVSFHSETAENDTCMQTEGVPPVTRKKRKEKKKKKKKKKTPDITARDGGPTNVHRTAKHDGGGMRVTTRPLTARLTTWNEKPTENEVLDLVESRSVTTTSSSTGDGEETREATTSTPRPLTLETAVRSCNQLNHH